MTYFVYNFQIFLLVLVRMNAMFTIAPFFSSGVVPGRLRVMLSFLITLIIFPTVSAKGMLLPDGMSGYYLLVLKEAVIGLYIGFLAGVVFAAFQLAAQYFAPQMGFSINEVFDPLSQISIPVIGQLFNLVGLLVFIAINGHHFLVQALYRSYELAPAIIPTTGFMGKLFDYILYSFGGMFIVALKISLPILGVLFLMSVSMGVLAKAAPQMNIMMMGLPLNVAVGFGLLILTTPVIVRVMQVALERSFSFITGVLHHWPAGT